MTRFKKNRRLDNQQRSFLNLRRTFRDYRKHMNLGSEEVSRVGVNLPRNGEV